MSNQNHNTPSFVIYSNGSRISTEIESGLKKIIISDNLNDLSGFKIRFNDYHFNLQRNKEISIGTELKISTGYKDDVENIITADITGFSLDINKINGTNFLIHGWNKLHMLNYSSDYLSFRKLSVEQIIRKLLSKSGIETGFENISFEKKIISFKYRNDLDFIKNACDSNNFIFYLRDKIFYLKKRSFNEQEDFVLEYDKTIIGLTIDSDISNFISDIEVKNYNYNKKKMENKTRSINDVSEIKNKINYYIKSKAVLIDKGIADLKSADEISKKILIKNNIGLKKLYGTSAGNTGIRAGALIKFNNISDDFSGIYLVKRAVHEISEKGYITGFYCEK